MLQEFAPVVNYSLLTIVWREDWALWGLILRHNTVRDASKALLDEVCKDIRTGANKQDGERADISALRF